MGHARHPLSLWLAALAAGLALAASGCGSSDEGTSSETTQSTSSNGGATTSTTPAGSRVEVCEGAIAGVGRVRASGTGCAIARGIVASWDNKVACGAAANGSRASCSVENYRCLGAATERGLAVTCARPGSSISFVAKRDSASH